MMEPNARVMMFAFGSQGYWERFVASAVSNKRP